MKVPVMKANGLSRNKIENFAQKVLKDFSPESLDNLIPLDIEAMFEQYIPKRFGIETSYEELSFGIYGYTDPNRLKSAVAIEIVDSDELSTIRFGRSTIGHEIGHAVLHARQFKQKKLETTFLHDGNHSKPILFRQEELKIYENPEWQAWEFCKSLFLPKDLIIKAVEDGMKPRDISESVNLNPAFVEVRLKNLKLT